MRVFINSSGIDLPAGATALDAVRALSEELAGAVDDGKRVITDSRGLPIDPATAMSAGSILRVIPRRDRGAADIESAAE